MNDLEGDVSPNAARQQLVERLTDNGWITRPEAAAAFLAVPRHEFAPAGTSMAAAYADDVVVTKRDPTGTTSSSISAPCFSLAWNPTMSHNVPDALSCLSCTTA